MGSYVTLSFRGQINCALQGDSRDFPSYFSEHQVGFSTDRRYVCGAEVSPTHDRAVNAIHVGFTCSCCKLSTLAHSKSATHFDSQTMNEVLGHTLGAQSFQSPRYRTLDPIEKVPLYSATPRLVFLGNQEGRSPPHPPPPTVATSYLQENWYDSNYFCSQYIDDTAVFLEIGGCQYDYPMGQCMDIDVAGIEGARGCAFKLETHMTNKVRGLQCLCGPTRSVRLLENRSVI